MPSLSSRCAGILIGEDALYRTLCIVKVAADGYNLDVPAFLRYHLQLLHRRYAVHRIVHHDLGARYIVEAVERCLAGITRGSDQNAGGTGLAGLAQGRGEQVRQHLQRHILERAGRAVPQLQDVHPFPELMQRRDRLAAEPFGRIGARRTVGDLLRGKVAQKQRENPFGALRIRQRRQRRDILPGKLRKALRHKQAAFFRKAADNRLRRRHLYGIVAGAVILHRLFHSYNHSFLSGRLCPP